MTEVQGFVVWPTVIVRLDERKGTLGVVTTGKGSEQEALIVFRGPEEAQKYQEHVGKHTSAEGYRLASLDLEELEALLVVWGLGSVAMPEPWTGEGMVDFFEASNFIAMLEESPRA